MSIESSPTNLPTGYRLRAPGPIDVRAILDLIAAYDIAQTGEPDAWSEDDILSDWTGTNPERDAWLIEADEGAVVAYGHVRDFGYGRIESDGYVHPAHAGKGLGSLLVDLAERRADEIARQAPEGLRMLMHSGTYKHDTDANALFTARGFTTVRHFWRMTIEMDEPPPAPRWPEGISCVPCVRNQHERVMFDTLEEAFADHWGHTPREYEEWRTTNVLMSSYDPDLWFLAMHGETPAGAIRGRVMEDGSGWVNTLGVLRPWRAHGLGMALLRQLLGVFYQRGIRTVSLGVDASNPTGATRLYERAGMYVSREFIIYEREIRAGIA